MINPIMNARRKKSNSEEWPWEWGDCLNLVNKLVLELFVTAMLRANDYDDDDDDNDDDGDSDHGKKMINMKKTQSIN